MDQKGFLYIMTTDGSPGLVKVGMTTKVPTERAKELGTTGVPKPYVVQYYALFDDMIQAEKKAQNALYKYHYGKEFYKIDVATAIYHIENVGIPFTRLYSKPEDDRVADKLRLKIQQEQEENERAEIKLHERKCREEEREREYWRHIVKTDKKELRGEELLHKIVLGEDAGDSTLIKKGKPVLLAGKTLMHLDDLMKSDKIIKQFVEERRERRNAHYQRKKLTKKVKKWFREMHGQGTHTWSNGNEYVGEWEYGEMNGQGTMTYASGEKYVGEWKDGEKHGHGIYTWPNGNKYVGEWEYNKKHGQGAYTYSSGQKYVGEFKDGMVNGQGTQTWPDGEEYVGEWKDGKMHSQGAMPYVSGNKQQLPEEELSKSYGLDLKELNIHGKVDPLVVTVSREEINSGDIEPALSILKQLISSPDMATTYKEKVDIAFHGYDTDSLELFEVPEARDYVHRLDEKFPF